MVPTKLSKEGQKSGAKGRLTPVPPSVLNSGASIPATPITPPEGTHVVSGQVLRPELPVRRTLEEARNVYVAERYEQYMATQEMKDDTIESLKLGRTEEEVMEEITQRNNNYAITTVTFPDEVIDSLEVDDETKDTLKFYRDLGYTQEVLERTRDSKLSEQEREEEKKLNEDKEARALQKYPEMSLKDAKRLITIEDRKAAGANSHIMIDSSPELEPVSQTIKAILDLTALQPRGPKDFLKIGKGFAESPGEAQAILAMLMLKNMMASASGKIREGFENQENGEDKAMKEIKKLHGKILKDVRANWGILGGIFAICKNNKNINVVKTLLKGKEPKMENLAEILHDLSQVDTREKSLSQEVKEGQTYCFYNCENRREEAVKEVGRIQVIFQTRKEFVQYASRRLKFNILTEMRKEIEAYKLQCGVKITQEMYDEVKLVMATVVLDNIKGNFTFSEDEIPYVFGHKKCL